MNPIAQVISKRKPVPIRTSPNGLCWTKRSTPDNIRIWPRIRKRSRRLRICVGIKIMDTEQCAVNGTLLLAYRFELINY